MKNLMKKSLVAGLAAVLAMSTLTACTPSDNKTIATVGDTKISFGLANFALRLQEGEYESYYGSLMGSTGADLWETEVDDDTTMEDSIKDSIMEELEEDYILDQHKDEYDVEITDEETEAMEAAADAFVEANDEDARDAVSGQKEYIVEYLRLVTVQNRMEDAIKAGVDTEVSDEEACQKAMSYVYFTFQSESSDDTDEIDDTVKEMVRASAEAFRDTLVKEDDPDIEEVAGAAGLEVSDCTFDADSTSPNADLIAAADLLKEGEITDLIETDDGIYVAQLTSEMDRDATDSKKDAIVADREDELYSDTLDGWKDELKISVSKAWDKVSLTKLGVTVVTEEETSDEETETTEDTSSTETTEDTSEETTSEETTEETSETTDASAK